MLLSENKAALRNLSALVDFSNLINSNLDLNFTLNNLLLTCLTKFHTTKGIVALSDDNGILHVESYKGITSDKLSNFPKLTIDEIEDENELETLKAELGIELFQPILSASEIKGVIFLGKRLDGKSYTDDDNEFLRIILNIASTAIQNSYAITKLKSVNRELDSKVNQLGSLFDLSKEFSGILEMNRISKLLVFSIIGQLLVSKFAVLTCEEGECSILESRLNNDLLNAAVSKCNFKDVSRPLYKNELQNDFEELSKMGIELIVPMKIKSVTKGLILLGTKNTHQPYSKSDIEYISSVGGLAIISIENGRLFDEALEKQRLEKDLEIAQNIQKNLLPNTLPKLKNFEISAFNQSARRVGGDYYDVVKLDEDRTLIAIADVSGKGVQAALLMANLQAFLQSISKQNIELKEASNLINDLVSENTTDGSFITFFWGILNDTTKEFKYVNMGHNPPLLVRKNSISKLKMGGMILGVMKTVLPYNSETVVLEKDDIILCFTDGITEAMTADGEEFSDERLEEFALKKSFDSSEELLDELKTEVEEFTKGAQQSDDITALIVKVS